MKNRQQHFVLRASAIALIASFLAGCVSPYEGKYSHSDGWHRARVVEVDTFAKLAEKYGDHCTKEVTSPAGRQGAVVGYQSGAGWRNQLMLLPEKANFKAGDLVYANVLQCKEPLVPRAS